MRLLADENVPLPSIEVIREAGHDVVSISEESPGVADADVLARASGDARILLTFDRDFGELVFRAGANARIMAASSTARGMTLSTPESALP